MTDTLFSIVITTALSLWIFDTEIKRFVMWMIKAKK
jgi:hypothetical protein